MLEAAATFAFVDDQAKSQGRERAAEAHELHALLVVTAPQLHRRAVKRALRQSQPQLRRRLQIMRACAAGAEDGASSSGMQHNRYDRAELHKG